MLYPYYYLAVASYPAAVYNKGTLSGCFCFFVNLQMQRFLVLFIILTIFFSCDDKTETTSVPVPQDTVKTNFFPVTDYIRGRLKELDSSENSLLKIVTQNGKVLKKDEQNN